MDYNENEEQITINVGTTTTTTTTLGTWLGDSRSCEQGQPIIYQCSTINRPINMNEIDNKSDQPITLSEMGNQPIKAPDTSGEAGNQLITSSEENSNSNNKPINLVDRNSQPIRFTFANSQTIRSSLTSSSESSDSSKTTTWGQVKAGSPTKSKKDSKSQKSKNTNSPNQSPTKNKNEKRNMTSWKNVSPTKSSSSSDLEHSNHSNHSNEYANRIFRFSTNRMKDFNDSTSSSELEQGCPEQQQKQPNEYANKNDSVSNQIQECKCGKESTNGGSPCKRSCNCSKKCNSHLPDNQNTLVNSNTSLNGSPKREKGSPEEQCDNDYFYEDDFTVQFDTNLRETSVTPIDSDPNTTILDFPNMVTGSYLCFNNGGSSNVSFNNSKASSNVSINNMRESNIIQIQALDVEDRGQYDSEFSGNSGSHNSTMEMSSSERDMMGSSDMIDFSDGPLFTPTPSHILSTDSLDKGVGRDHVDGEMSGSNASGETNLNVDCGTKKEEYFLSFDGSHSRVSGSDTDISISFTSHDSCQGNSETSITSHDFVPHNYGHGGHDRSLLSSTEGQDETSDSFHICFNKLSPIHKKHQYAARENLSGRVLKLVPLKETQSETGDSSDDENLHTSPTLTAGSKELSTLSTKGSSPKKKVIKPQEVFAKLKGGNSKIKGKKSENLYLVGIGKPLDILRKAGVHSHTLPRVKNLVSWKQLKSSAKNVRKGDSCVSLPDLSGSTSWQNIAGLKCRNLAEVTESFHSKRHSASLLEFYQRMKSQSNPVSPETMNNLEHILWPNFIGQKTKPAEMSDSSTSSQECTHCQCNRQPAGLSGSVTKAYTNKRIFDWLKMECSSSSRESNRPNSLACQTANVNECFNKETLISPGTVTLWCGTKTVGSQFPPATKESSCQTIYDHKFTKDMGFSACISKKDQSLQTSDFEEEEILSILSDNFDDFHFLRSNEGIAKEFLSCPEKLYLEKDSGHKFHRSKSADEYRHNEEKFGISNKDGTNNSYHGYDTNQACNKNGVGRSKSTGRLGMKSESPRRMGISHHYSHQSLPDIAFLTSSVTIEKEESKESLFDPLKLDLPIPVTVAPKTELENFNIYQQTTKSCHNCQHHKRSSSCCDKVKGHKGQSESGSSSSGVFTSSASSGIDPGYCECRSRSTTSPQNDLERLIFFPPHTELSRKDKSCCGTKRRAHSVPAKLSDCAKTDVKFEKYTNEVHPKVSAGSKGQGHVQGKKWNHVSKNSLDEDKGENLYALEEEKTPVASPERKCCHDVENSGCHSNSCTDGPKFSIFSGGHDFTESDFYREMAKENIIFVENDVCYRGMSVDSTSSSGSSVPNGDRKPLKSCLSKKNRALRSRSLTAADSLALNFDDMDEKVKNRHSYACDEVYIVSDEHGQLMMYQTDDSAEPVMFYLGKDGECHMTEGGKTHLEHLDSYPNYDIQAVDSIHGSDSSTEREGSNKRKSVSFASEVSFQNISPALSPRKPATDGKDEGRELPKDLPTEQGEVTGGKESDVKTDTASTTADQSEISTAADNQSETSIVADSQSDEGSSSSSDTPPEEFQVTMDTNDNLWSEEVMLENIGLLMDISKASDSLIAHFAKSKDTFDKLRLGNTSETPEIGQLVLSGLCPAVSMVICNRLKPHLPGLQMFGRVHNITVWKLVEASVEILPQTRAVSDLVLKVKQTTYLTTHQHKFDAFIFGLLNLRLLDFWMDYIRQKETHLAKYYESNAIMVHCNTALQKQYDDMITATQPLSVLPFQLNTEYIQEKALLDSKLHSQALIGSRESFAGRSANQNASYVSSQSESTNEVMPTEVTSVLELTATKALNWLAGATFSKKKSTSDSQDLSESRSKSFDSANQMTDSNSTANQISGSFSFHGDEKDFMKTVKVNKGAEKLSPKLRNLYSDAKISRVDCDPIISPTESMRSSQSSVSSIFSNVVARFDKSGQQQVQQQTGNQSDKLSLSQSMTNSATSLVSKIMQFGSALSTKQQQTAYKRGVTEYSFEEGLESGSDKKLTVDKSVSDQKLANKDGLVPQQECDTKTETETQSKLDIEEVKLRTPNPEARSLNNQKRVSFDIVNLFDKLLLPSASKTDTAQKSGKPVSRIPVPTNRWSWSFGAVSKQTASPTKVTKTATKSDPEISKKEHFPKKSASSSTPMPKITNKATSKSVSTAPPKPPRIASSQNVGGSKRDLISTKSDTALSGHVKKGVSKKMSTL